VGLLFFYSLRNLLTRRLTTVLTASGMALVVFVFASILMLAEGLQKTLVDTGSFDNVVGIRRSSVSEVQSGVDRVQASIVETVPEVASGPRAGRSWQGTGGFDHDGKTESGSRANVVIRGISEDSFLLRPQVRLAVGRTPKPGSSEIIIGRSIEKGFQGADLGKSLFFAMRSWTVVGVFDAGSTGFSSEIWGDVDQLMQAFRRPVYSSLLFRLRESADFERVKTRIEKRSSADPGGQARNYLLQGPIRDDGQISSDPGAVSHHRFFHRRGRGRDDHHVRFPWRTGHAKSAP